MTEGDFSRPPQGSIPQPAASGSGGGDGEVALSTAGRDHTAGDDACCDATAPMPAADGAAAAAASPAASAPSRSAACDEDRAAAGALPIARGGMHDRMPSTGTDMPVDAAMAAADAHGSRSRPSSAISSASSLADSLGPATPQVIIHLVV